MGLDVVVDMPSPPLRHDPAVRIEEAVLDDPDESYPVLRKEYITPTGSLRAEVVKALAAERDLLTMACYGMVGDVACWLAGIQPLTMVAADRPDFAHRFLLVIDEWKAARDRGASA